MKSAPELGNGFRSAVAMSDPAEPAAPAKARPNTAWLIFSSGLIGAVVGPVALVALFLVMTSLDPSCRGGGNEGGCAMGVWAGGIAGVPIGFVIGLVVGVVRALRRGAPKSPDSAATPAG